MHISEAPKAILAAIATASELGLIADDATVIQDSNRVTLRLLPCDSLARVSPAEYQANAEFEVEVAGQLAATGSPVAALEPRIEPRVYVRDGFVVNFWSYYEPASPAEIAPPDYAHALAGLHAGMRRVAIPAPHFTDRVAEAQRILAGGDCSPDLPDEDRELVTSTLRDVTRAILDRGAPEQLLHGEPHPGNLLSTKHGPLFIDFETCCRGPIEFDIAHAPGQVRKHYPGTDRELVRECGVLAIALVAAWRSHPQDSFPNGNEQRRRILTALRAART
jgi:hypothetical protein